MADGVQNDLIYDVGLHKGEDTAYYLKKGFRVVAIDANEGLCEDAGRKFVDDVASGQLIVLNVAIADTAGTVEFFEYDHSEFGTIDADFVKRHDLMGVKSLRSRKVEAMPLSDVVARYGTPYYLKIDIEGLDMVALRSLSGAPVMPSYISIESDKDSFQRLRKEFELLEALGYDRFKAVSQRWVEKQKASKPAREGKYADHVFAGGSSGAFGEESPGKWLTAEDAISSYKPIFLHYALTGDDPFIRSRFLRNFFKALGMRTNWHDTHARHKDRTAQLS